MRCASGSVGRAQPCQGWGRGFESRLALCILSLKNRRRRFFFGLQDGKIWLHIQIRHVTISIGYQADVTDLKWFELILIEREKLQWS